MSRCLSAIRRRFLVPLLAHKQLGHQLAITFFVVATILLPFHHAQAAGSAPVTVVNTMANPVPVTSQGTSSITGSVSVTNTNANPVPVTGSVNISGTPNVTVVGGSVNVGTTVIADFEADNLDSSQHKFGPFDISKFSRIRFRVTANGTGTVVADIETDGLGDFFSLDAGNVESRLYEVPGTTATIFLNGDPSITQVFVKLFGS